MGPEYGALPPSKGSDVRGLGLCRVYKGSPVKGPYWGTIYLP